MKKIVPLILFIAAVSVLMPTFAGAATPTVKKILVIPVKYAYNPGSYPVSVGDILPLTPTLINTNASEMKTFIEANFYGQVTINVTASPTLTHPVVAPFSCSTLFTYPYGWPGIRDWAIANVGPAFNVQEYDYVVVAASYISGCGFNAQAFFGNVPGGKPGFYTNGDWFSSIWTHEFGHTLNMDHAKFWVSYNGDIIGDGFSINYGNPFDVMGTASNSSEFPKRHFNVFAKQEADWLYGGQNWVIQQNEGIETQAKTPGGDTVSTTQYKILNILKNHGTYRIYAMDALKPSGLIGLKVKADSQYYWVEFRQALINYPRLMNGVSINRTYHEKHGSTYLLDFTPETPGAIYPAQINGPGRFDSPLLIGQTFSDMGNDIHITPIAKGGTNPESIDVVIHKNTLARNTPPTGTLSASTLSVAVNTNVTLTMAVIDRDSGETFAYYWQFKKADGTPNTTKIAANTHQIQTSWDAPGTYEVKCTVSDMKGGTVSKVVLITVN